MKTTKQLRIQLGPLPTKSGETPEPSKVLCLLDVDEINTSILTSLITGFLENHQSPTEEQDTFTKANVMQALVNDQLVAVSSNRTDNLLTLTFKSSVPL